jgi:hypothetical protein
MEELLDLYAGMQSEEKFSGAAARDSSGRTYSEEPRFPQQAANGSSSSSAMGSFTNRVMREGTRAALRRTFSKENQIPARTPSGGSLGRAGPVSHL